MYPSYPTSQPPQQPSPPQLAQPRSVKNAVRLMYAGAALQVISIIVGIATISSFRHTIAQQFPNYTASQLHTAEVAGIVSTVVFGLVTIGLWLWMAWANGRGKRWGKVVATVLFALNTLSVLLSLVSSTVRVGGGTILGVVVWLVGLAAIFFIYSRDSAPFYQQRQQLYR